MARLKLYLGFAAAVGKTYRMLEEAHTLADGGADIVLAFVDAHGRADTAALVDGLEVVPRRRVEFRGVAVEEMDLDALLARKPAIAVVDELAHTNVPGSRNKRRFEDVLQLLDAGIDVIGALDADALQSLHDRAVKNGGARSRETVPDSLLARADEIVSLERTATARAPLGDQALRPGTASRVMVCLSSYPPHAATLLQRGSRMAGRLSSEWFVVYVETPKEAPERIDAAAHAELAHNLEAARALGAEIVRLKGSDPVAALVDFARSHGVAHIIIGRSHQPWWRQIFGRGVPLRVVREAAGFDVHIVSFVDEERAS